jgi:DNA ligase 1
LLNLLTTLLKIMYKSKPWEVIHTLESDNSRLFKEQVIVEQAQMRNEDFFAGCRLALDPMITFGLKQVPEKKDSSGTGLGHELFLELCTQLSSRIATGNNARDLVQRAMNMATPDEWNLWCRRILIKDLRCGVSEKTINKAVEKINADYIVPTFSCQLAHDSANHEGKLAGSKLVEVKLDGVRVITIVWPDGRVLQFSRNGKELVNFEHVKEQLAAVAQGFNEPMVLDGEIMSSSFQDLMKQVHRKDNVAAGDAVLNLFDYLTLKEFEAGGAGSARQEHRSIMLAEWYATVQDALPNVAVLSHEAIDMDTESGQAQFRAINQRAIDGGYEGIMIKDPAAAYECKRSTAWLKLKPFIEVSLAVVDFEEGTGRNAGRLGAIICEGEDDGRGIRVNVGSGFSDANRDDFWVDREAIVGHVAEVRADAVTQNQDGTYSLRFPRFLRFRGFTAGEKI